MGNSATHITLLVTTRGRIAALRALFASITTSAAYNVTVLLGDQNEPHYLDALLEEFQEKLHIERHMLAPQSLSSARNALLPYVKEGLVAITDDDCEYTPTTLEAVNKHFALHATVAAIIGNANAVTPVGHMQEETLYSVFKNAPSWVLFFRSATVELVGTFDENMGIGSPGPCQSGEETDYLLRILEKDHRIIRTSDVLVHHPEPNLADPALPAKAKAYGMGRMHLLRKHKFPLWFKLANVLYPLLRLPLEGKKAWAYRKAMFLGRLKGLLHLH